jgi:hypothetical protein
MWNPIAAVEDLAAMSVELREAQLIGWHGHERWRFSCMSAIRCARACVRGAWNPANSRSSISDARGIPAENLIALEMPKTADISRENTRPRSPSRCAGIRPPRLVETRPGPGGHDGSRHQQDPRAGDPARRAAPHQADAETRAGAQAREAHPPIRSRWIPSPGRDEASVDSELAMFGVEGVPPEGGLQNKYHQSEKKSPGRICRSSSSPPASTPPRTPPASA